MDFSRASDIKIFITDVDGTLTDGGMYYTAQGEFMKRFNTRDAKGLELLRRSGITVAIMTQEESQIVLARAAKLKLEHVFIGVTDKRSCLMDLCARLGWEPAQAAYVGDDVNDLEVMATVGISFAVADAAAEVLKAAKVRLTKPGGYGAVREAAEWVLARLPEA